MYTIGKLAASVNLSVETIRYYETLQLIQQPIKPESGYRHYPDSIRIQLLFIKQAQGLGFTLNEIKKLLSLSHSNCSDVKVIAETKLISVQEKLSALKRLEATLSDLVLACENNSDLQPCPIIESLVLNDE